MRKFCFVDNNTPCMNNCPLFCDQDQVCSFVKIASSLASIAGSLAQLVEWRELRER